MRTRHIAATREALRSSFRLQGEEQAALSALRNPRAKMTFSYTYEPEMWRALHLMNGNAIAHFRLRASSWGMAVVNLAVGFVLTVNPEALTRTGAAIFFAHLLHVISPEMWRNAFVCIGASRLAALYINGTYPSIWWTPHVRLIMSLISFAIWIQFAISVLASGILTIGSVLYCTTVAVEGYNVAIASTETRPRLEGDFG